MAAKLKQRKKSIKPILFLIAVVLLLSGCSAQNGDTKQQGKSPASAVTASNSTSVNASAAADANAAAAAGTNVETVKQVQFPDIQRKPRDIENKYGVFYEIFVRSFVDSNNDGIGDFKGLASRLDYLNDNNPATNTDLGINGIYLMPVNVSPSYHKYDVTDYYNIDPEYGTMDDFKTFLAEAHKRGIKVIMDLVVNHTSSQNPWFKESSKSWDNPFRDYYTWAKEGQKGYNIKGTSPWGSKAWHALDGSYYYGIFWDQMPDLNYDNPKVREEIKKIEKFWLEKGVDGFRLDAAMHIYGAYENPAGTNLQEKNLQWWKEFGAAAEEVNPDAYLIGEVWDKTFVVAPYYKGLDSLFNFDVGEGIINVVNSGTNKAVGGKGFSPWLEEKYSSFAEVEPNFLDAPFLSNHDQNRSMGRLNGDIDKAKLAAGIYLTLPGNPFIYYGEEIGMLGSKPDERIREPFVWSKETKSAQGLWESIASNLETVPEEVQQKDPASLLNYYKKLIRVRQSSEALMKGDFKAMDAGSSSVVAYSRSRMEGGNVKESVIVLHNLSSEKQTVTFKNEDLSNAKIIFESNGKGRHKINSSSIVISSKATVILRK